MSEPTLPTPYAPAAIEPKWRDRWADRGTNHAALDHAARPFYALMMFPYPSAALHVGHGRNYIIGDAVARYKMMRGFRVLTPMGFDAFGLPAEQYAIQTGTHPADTTAKNVARFRQQLKMLGFSYDWQREVSTTDAEYYK